MKRLMSLSLALLASVGFSATTTYTATEGGRTWSYTLDRSGNVTVTSVVPVPSDMVIPDRLGGRSVTAIDDFAFEYCEALESVKIPSTVANIGECAFIGCENLSSLTLEEGVNRIGMAAFADCLSLASVTIPSSMTYMEMQAFDHCTNLASVVIRNGVQDLGLHTFGGCTALKSVSIPASVEEVGMGVFSGCSSLSSVKLAEGILEIADDAFADCESLSEINIPSSVISIGDAFDGCTALGAGMVIVNGCLLTVNGSCPETVEIPQGVRLIAAGAFWRHEEINDVRIPSSVVEIGFDAFGGCGFLGDGVIIRDGCVLHVGEDAPAQIRFPDTVRLIASGAFQSSYQVVREICFYGNAPKVKDYEFEYLDAVVRVLPGSTGWLSAGSDELPERWPVTTYGFGLPIEIWKARTPMIVVRAGQTEETRSVVLSCADNDATIYFTTDGSAPGVRSAVYAEPIEVSSACVVRALAIVEGIPASEVAEKAIDPTVPVEWIWHDQTETDGEFPWTLDELNGHVALLGRSPTADDVVSWLELKVQGRGHVAFDWEISGLCYYDVRFMIDGEIVAEPAFYLSDSDEHFSWSIFGEGEHTLRWEIDGDAGDLSVKVRDVTFTPIPDEVTITLDPVLGAVKPNRLVKATGGTYGDLPVPTRAGSKFHGWGLTYDGAKVISPGDELPVEDVTLYALWETPVRQALDPKGRMDEIELLKEDDFFDDPWSVAIVRLPVLLYDEKQGQYVTNYVYVEEVRMIAGFTNAVSTNVFCARFQGVGNLTVQNFFLASSSLSATLDGVPLAKGNSSPLTQTILTAGEHVLRIDINVTSAWGWYGQLYLGAINWERAPDEIVVCFDPMCGRLEERKKTYKTGTAYGELPVPTSAEGYEFEGWSRDKAGLSRVRASDYVDFAATNLYALWKGDSNVHTIDYELEGGVNSPLNPSRFMAEDLPITLAPPTWTGHTFAGWTPNGGVIARNTESNVLFRATWQTNHYTVSFNANGGTGEMLPQSFAYDEPQPLTSNAYVRAGYKFMGWTLGDAAFSDGETVSNLTARADGQVVLRANWEAKSYVVVFDPNGGQGEMESQKIAYGESTALTLNSYTRPGYAFVGWRFNGRLIGNGVRVLDLAAETESAVVLTAEWKMTLSIDVLSVRQRYPWNGLVDVRLDVLWPDVATNVQVEVYVGENKDSQRQKVVHVWLADDASRQGLTTVRPGVCNLTLDAGNVFTEALLDAAVLEMKACVGEGLDGRAYDPDSNASAFANVLLDTRSGARIANSEEAITFSPAWGTSASCCVRDGETVLTNATEEGILAWLPANAGRHELVHEAGEMRQTAAFVVLDDGVRQHRDDVSGTEVWEADAVHLIEGTVCLQTGSSLVVEPGAVVKFSSGAMLQVAPGASCTAEGVIFTSVHDDTVGGDTLFDGSETLPAHDDYAIEGLILDDNATEYRYCRVQTTVDAVIDTNTWLQGMRVYCLEKDVVVKRGATLAIGPGAVIKFAKGCSLIVEGALDAVGTRLNPIVFTSLSDDAHGGDTNGDGDATQPNAGDWYQIGVSGTATFSNVHVFYNSSVENHGGLECLGGDIVFDNSEIAETLYECVNMHGGGTFTANNSIFRDSSLAFGYYGGSGVKVVNSVVAYCTTAVRQSNKRFFNTIFYNCRNFTDQGGNGSKFQYCCFYNPEGFGVQNATAYNRDTCIWADPQFLDPESNDFRLAATSPCVDAGTGAEAPETDRYGSPRMDVPTVRDTGTAAANGACPDIGIFEVEGTADVPSADLAVTSVTAPESFVVGEKIRVSWTVRNLGEVAASGTWRDAVALVTANGQSLEMGSSVATLAVPAGGSQTFTEDLTVPSGCEGTCRIRVTANAQRDLFEAGRTDNNVGLSGACELSVGTISLPTDGSETPLALEAGAQTAFALDNDTTAPAVILIRSTGELSAWLGNGMTAMRDNAVRSAVQVAEDLWLLEVPANADARISLSNDGIQQSIVNLSLETGAFLLLDVEKTSAGNAGSVTIPFCGNGFADGMECWLSQNGRRIKDADEIVLSDSLRGSAVIDVTGLPAGAYRLHLKKGEDEVSAELLTLTATESAQAHWNCGLILAEAVRANRVYVGKFGYENIGNAAKAAPYVTLKGSDGTLLRLSESDAWSESVDILAISPTYPASSVKPGESNEIAFYYKTSGATANVTFECAGATRIVGEDGGAVPLGYLNMGGVLKGPAAQSEQVIDSEVIEVTAHYKVVRYTVLVVVSKTEEPVDWDTLSGSMRPTYVPQKAWNVAFPKMQRSFGPTWKSYIAKLAADADYLMKIGQPTYRVDRLLRLEMNEALGVDLAVPRLASATDISRACRGPSLSFSRSYATALTQRQTKGVLGYGWSASSEAFLEEKDAETLVFHLPGGSSYSFAKATGVWAPEDARDRSTLTETESAYVLTALDGTVQTYAKSMLRLSSVSDNQGHAVVYTYGGSKLVRAVHSDGQYLSFTYDGDLLASVSDDLGHVVTYGYENDKLVSVTRPDGLVTRYAYRTDDGSAVANALVQTTSADGTTRDFTWDENGRIATMSVNGTHQTTSIRRGAYGSYVMVAPNGAETAVTVGVNGETLKTVNALGETVTQAYTDDNLLESTVAPSGKRNKIAYDKFGSPISSMSASGATTSFSYGEDFGSLDSVTDAKGHAFRYGYDALGRSTSVGYEDGSASTLEYNEKGDVVKSTNRRGQAVVYAYDAEGRLVRKTWDNGRTFTLTYDAKGNVSNAADSVTGAVTMEYDANERLTRIVYPKNRGFTFKYDEVGRMIERVTLDGGRDGAPSPSAKECYEYDAFGRLSRVTDGTSAYLTNAYDPTTGWLVTQTYGNGTVVSNAYDILGRTIGIYHLKNGTRLAFFEYAYDADGKCLSQTTAEGVERYTYDADGQLTGVTYPDGTSETFAYDAVGNRTVAKGDTYEVNELNQYTSISTSTSTSTSFTYDLDGNMTARADANGTTTYAYDTLNRLVAVTNEAKNIRWSCEYDVFGNRTSVTDNGTTTEKVFVQGSLASVAAEYVNDTLAKRHVIVGAIRLADIESGATRYYHGDMIGSTRLTTDATGAQQSAASYKAFGALRKSSGAQTDAGYVGTLGIEADANGLLFMRNRYYDAGLGRFVQMDPIGCAGGDVNLYDYCNANSVSHIDSKGEKYSVEVRTRALNSYYVPVLPLVSNRYRHWQVLIKDENGNVVDNVGFFDNNGGTWRRDNAVLIANEYDNDPSSLVVRGELNIDSYGGKELARMNEIIQELNSRGIKYKMTSGYQSYIKGDIDDGTQNCQPSAIQAFMHVMKHFKDNGFPPPDEIKTETRTVKISWDPNEMSGPAGVGEKRFVQQGEWMNYTVYFENKTNATAAAQEVFVDLPMDENLDWSTLELGEIAFGAQIDLGLVGKSHGTSIYANPGSNTFVKTTVTQKDGVLSWYIRDWDPTTPDNFPASVEGGFLPPNDPATHCGEGHVSYRVRVKDTAPDGAIIRASAQIVFDSNPMIETDPAWWNTVGQDVATAAFATSEIAVDEGATIELTVSGGNAEKASSVAVYLTYQTAAAADLDLAKSTVDGATPKGGVKFPLTLSWAKGEVTNRVIRIPVKTDKTVEDDETLVFQLAAAQGQELGETCECKVTIRDTNVAADYAEKQAKTTTKTKKDVADNYGLNIACVAGDGSGEVCGYTSGQGTYYKGCKASLKATARPGWEFKGWGEVVGGVTNVVSEKASWNVTLTNEAEVVALFGRIPYVAGLADPADGGKVTGSGSCATGKKVTLKAKANKNFTFVGWYAAAGGASGGRGATALPADEPVSRLASFVVDRSAKPAKPSKTQDVITNVNESVTYYARFKSDPEVFVSVAATDGKGDALAGKGAGKYAAGTIVGAGKYAKDKKVTLKATANRGYVFAGWWPGGAAGGQGLAALPAGEPVSRLASCVLTMPTNDVEMVAAFVTAEEDKASIGATVNGFSFGAGSGGEGAAVTKMETNVWAGVYLEWPVAASALSETTVKVAGLPSGLKFTAKPVTTKVGTGKTAVTVTNVPANTIYGAPTAASKTAKSKDGTVTVKPSAVKVTVTTAGKNAQTYQIDMAVDPLPSWAVGTFAGPSYGGGRGAAALPGDAVVTNGAVTVTVAASGKITAKQPVDGKSTSFTANYFDVYDGESFWATLTAKSGKIVLTNEMAVSGHAGRVTLPDGSDATVTNGVIHADRFDAWQYGWKAAPWKSIGKTFDKLTLTYYVAADGTVVDEDDEVGLAALGGGQGLSALPVDGMKVIGRVTLKFAAKGLVSVAGEFAKLDEMGALVYKNNKLQTVKASGSATLLPTVDEYGETRYLVFVYLAPKELPPHARCLVVGGLSGL